MPVAVKVHDRVEVPEPVTPVGETPQDSVVFVATFTRPAKPFWPVIVMVDVPAAFTFTLTLAGLAAFVKSWTT